MLSPLRYCRKCSLHFVNVCASMSISVGLHRSVGLYVLQRCWYTHEAPQMKGQRVAQPLFAAAPPGKGRSPLRAAGSPGALLSLTAQESPGLLTDLQAHFVLNLSSEVCCRKWALSSFIHAAQDFTPKQRARCTMKTSEENLHSVTSLSPSRGGIQICRFLAPS